MIYWFVNELQKTYQQIVERCEDPHKPGFTLQFKTAIHALSMSTKLITMSTKRAKLPNIPGSIADAVRFCS